MVLWYWGTIEPTVLGLGWYHGTMVLWYYGTNATLSRWILQYQYSCIAVVLQYQYSCIPVLYYEGPMTDTPYTNTSVSPLYSSL